MKLLRLIALSTIVIGASQAAMVTHSSSATFNTAPSALVFAPDIPLFDPSMGTLIQVDIEFDGIYNGDFTFTNTSGTDGDISGSSTGNLTLKGPGSTGNLVVLNPAISFTVPTIPSPTIPAAATVNFNGLSASASGSKTLTAPADLAAFTGLGSVSFAGSTVSIASAPFLPFAGTFDAVLSGQADLKVTYTYEPGGPNEVPEPATWAFMAGGGLILLSMARFRKPVRD